MWMNGRARIGTVSVCACLLFFCFGGFHLFGKTVAITGGRIHTMEGQVFASGTVLIRDGKIVAVGEDIEVPEDAEVIAASGYILYPGFVACSGLFSAEELKNFESISPDASALDRFDFYGDYIRYLRGGITSAFVAMPANRIISGRGAVVKLRALGNSSPVLKERAALSINLGKNAILPPMTDIFPAPVSVENPLVPSIKQFPSSSLGAFWLLNELFRPEPFSGDLSRYFQNVANSLKEAQDHGLPLIVKCQEDADIQQAILFARSIKMPLIIQGDIESLELADVLIENSIPIVVEADVRPNGSWVFENTMDSQNRMKNIPRLIQKGICVALTPVEDRYLSDLFWVAQYFQKYGISEEEIVKTITLNPAKIFGCDDRVGSLAKGKDADVLFFKRESGVPLPVLKKVMSEGQIVYEEK
jgi:hypothetical protein